MDALNEGLLGSLPSELLRLILNYSDAYDVVNLSMTTKIFVSQIWQLVLKFYLPYTSSSKIGLLFNKPFIALEDFEIHYKEHLNRPVSFDCFNGCKSLTRMWVSNKLPVEHPIKLISNITTLRELTLENLNVFGDTLDFSKHLTQHTRLTSLAVQSDTILHIENTSYMTRLRSLSLNISQLQTMPDKVLAPLTNLTYLKMYSMFSSTFFAALTNLRDLIWLDVPQTIPDCYSSDPMQLAHFKSYILNKENRNIETEDYDSISRLTNLRSFSTIMPFDISALPNLEKLEIGSDLFKELLPMSKVVDLTVHDTFITPDASNIFNLTQLTRLAIIRPIWHDTNASQFFSEISKLSNLVQFEYDGEVSSADLIQNLQGITTLQKLTVPIEHVINSDSMTILTQLRTVNLISESRKKFNGCAQKHWPFDFVFVLRQI